MRRGREEKGEVKRGSCKGEKEEKRSGKRRTGRRREGGGRVWKDGERKHAMEIVTPVHTHNLASPVLWAHRM